MNLSEGNVNCDVVIQYVRMSFNADAQRENMRRGKETK